MIVYKNLSSGDNMVTIIFKNYSSERKTFGFIGSPGRTRTADPVINSHLLYRLSYRGIYN
jgi:hypothetical protein